MAKRTRRKVHNPATLYKMRVAKLGSKNPMHGKHHSKETVEKIRKKLLEHWKTIIID